MVIPYIQGLAESFKSICGKDGIQTYFKGNTTIKKSSWNPRTRTPRTKKLGNLQLPVQPHCLWWGVHRGDIKDPWWEIHGTPKATLSHPCAHTANRHNTTDTSFNIIGREDQGLARIIKESIYIRVNNPTLNCNIGKYNLSHIWDRVLFNTPRLKLGSSQLLSAQT